MKNLILIFAVLGSTLLAQTGKDVQVCWTPAGGTPTCQTFTAGSVTILTLDLRQTPVEYVVVQPLPAYQIAAMQTHVTNQSYNLQQGDGSLKMVQRYSSVQDLLIQNLIRNMLVPIIQLYPPSGADAGKNTFAQVAADIVAGTQVTPIQ